MTTAKLNIQRVYEFLKSCIKTPDRIVTVDGAEIEEATGLTRAQVYDTIWLLQRKKLIKKVHPGARHRKMVIRVLEPEPIDVPTGEALLHWLGDTWPCPHCGRPIDLRRALGEKRKFLQDALARLDALETEQEGKEKSK